MRYALLAAALIVSPSSGRAAELTSDNLQAILLSRGLERLAIIAVAALSLFLGYRLFAIATDAKSAGEFKSAPFSFKLRNVGPGVFFGLFGALVLVFDLSSKVELGPEPPAPAPDQLHQQSQLKWGVSTPEMDERGRRTTILQSYNTLALTIDLMGSANHPNEEQLNQARTAVNTLSFLRDDAIQDEFDRDKHKKYLLFNSLRKTAPEQFAQLDAAEKELFETVDKYATQTLASEANK